MKGLPFERIGKGRYYHVVFHIGSTYVPVSDESVEELKTRAGNRKYKRPFGASGNVPKKQRKVNHALSGLKIRGFQLARRALPVPVPRMLPRIATHVVG